MTVATSCGCGMPLTIPRGFDHSKCDSCGDFWFPTSIEKSQDAIVPQNKTTPFSCPRCQVDLEVGKIGKTELCFCPSCRGFVIDSVSLGHLIMHRRAEYRGADDQPIPADYRQLDVPGTCPACFAKLSAHHYGGPGNVVIDSCIHCKLAWMDHGELAKIVRGSGER